MREEKEKEKEKNDGGFCLMMEKPEGWLAGRGRSSRETGENGQWERETGCSFTKIFLPQYILTHCDANTN